MNKLSIIQTALRSWRMFVLRFLPDQNSEFPEMCLAGSPDFGKVPESSSEPRSILDTIIDNGFLWGVPKNRRSLERRMTRRMGFNKLLYPQKTIVSCHVCGDFHLVHTVCGNCYNKVKEETKILQEAVMKELKLDPIDKEVVILYENENSENKEFFGGKRIVELPKERPKWFSKNLLVKDSELQKRQNSSVKEAAFTPEVHEIK